MINEMITTEEILSVEELDLVSGGSYKETSQDTKVLYEYGLVNDEFNKIDTVISWDSVSNMVDKGWEKAGISCITKPYSGNEYKINVKGKYYSISRGEAILYLQKKFGNKE